MNAVEKAGHHCLSVRTANSNHNINSSLLERRKSAAIYAWIGILNGANHTRNACTDDRVRTRRRFSPMAARLQRYKECGSVRRLTGVVNRLAFSMGTAGIVLLSN